MSFAFLSRNVLLTACWYTEGGYVCMPVYICAFEYMYRSLSLSLSLLNHILLLWLDVALRYVDRCACLSIDV